MVIQSQNKTESGRVHGTNPFVMVDLLVHSSLNLAVSCLCAENFMKKRPVPINLLFSPDEHPAAGCAFPARAASRGCDPSESCARGPPRRWATGPKFGVPFNWT